MPTPKSLQELAKLRDQVQEKRVARSQGERAQNERARITVGTGTCGIASGARETMKAILDVIERENLEGITVAQMGCIGRCEWEPIVRVVVGDGPEVTYGHVSAERARKIVKEHVMSGQPVKELAI